MKITEVWRGEVIEGSDCEEQDFIVNVMGHKKLVQLLQHRGDVVGVLVLIQAPAFCNS